MKIIKTVKEIRKEIQKWKNAGEKVGFVPTMGYLHEGHASLISKANEENDRVVVSIFVNPIQFGPKEDLKSYPRDLEKDKKICKTLGADLIFNPEQEEMYPEGFSSFVDMTGLTEELCGKSRPTHFSGVCTVVCKLFNIVQPDRAYFGQKDAQQFAVIKRMVNDLNMDIDVIGCPIIRDEDGLAKSSRNAYLSDTERKAALILSKSIILGQKIVTEGEQETKTVIAAMKKCISEEPMAKIDYVKAVDKLTMKQTDKVGSGVLVALAVHIGKIRLIDNFMI